MSACLPHRMRWRWHDVYFTGWTTCLVIKTWCYLSCVTERMRREYWENWSVHYSWTSSLLDRIHRILWKYLSVEHLINYFCRFLPFVSVSLFVWSVADSFKHYSTTVPSTTTSFSIPLTHDKEYYSHKHHLHSHSRNRSSSSIHFAVHDPNSVGLVFSTSTSVTTPYTVRTRHRSTKLPPNNLSSRTTSSKTASVFTFFLITVLVIIGRYIRF